MLSNNKNMNGRLFGIKKSALLKSFAILGFLSYVTFIFLSIFYFKSPSIWFYGFCLFLGCFEISKAFLFRFDSSLYLGSLLASIGTVCFIFHFTNTSSLAAFYICLAFIIASLIKIGRAHV